MEVNKMTGLGESILLEGEARGINKGVVLSAEVFKAVQSGEYDNAVIARQCGCAVKDVERIREEFGI